MACAVQKQHSRCQMLTTLPPSCQASTTVLEDCLTLFCSFPLVTPSTGSSLALVEQLCVKGLDVLEKLVRPTSDGSTSLK